MLLPPRKTLLHGNTVYDVPVMSSGQVPRVDPEIMDQFNTEANRLTNDVEMLESELEPAECSKRDAVDDRMDECMTTIEMQSQTIDLLTNEVKVDKQIHQFYKQSTDENSLASAHLPQKTNACALSADEKHYQKKLFLAPAKRAHQLAKTRLGKKRFVFNELGNVSVFT